MVADEVRSLALRSGDAARRTRALLEASAARVGDGQRLGDQVAAVLVTVDAAARETDEALDGLARDSRAQRDAVEATVREVRALDAQLREVTTASGSSADAARALATLATQLTASNERFRLEADAPPADRGRRTAA